MSIQDKSTPLYLAAKGGQTDVAEVLLQYQLKIDHSLLIEVRNYIYTFCLH